MVNKADVTGASAIHSCVDEKLFTNSKVLPVSHTTITLVLLLPLYGVWHMEKETYGSLRRSGVIFDWIIGTLIPVILCLAGVLLEENTSTTVGIALFGVIRIGVVIVGNDHVREHNEYLRKRLLEGDGVGDEGNSNV